MIVGFYLLMVTILPTNGFVTGDVLDYYESKLNVLQNSCFAEAVDLELNGTCNKGFGWAGLAFTCKYR